MLKNLLLTLSISLVTLLPGAKAFAAKSAVVSIDGAMVYRESNFDAPVIAYLKKGKRISVSNKTFGPFFKVKLRPGVVGFISDIDVQIENSNKGGDGFDDDDDDSFGDGKKKRRKRKRKSKDRSKRRNQDFDEPIFSTKYIGLTGGVINFKEEVLQQKVSSNTNSLGIKVSGPDLLFRGPYIFDINLMVSLGPPNYYTTITDPGTKPSGMFVLLDALMLFPVMSGYDQNWMVYLGGGPLLAYSKFAVTIINQALDLQQFKLGGSFVGGVGFQIGSFVVKVDGKYYVEKSSYFGVLGAVQKRF